MAGKCYITTVKDFPFVKGKTRIDYVYEKNVYGFGEGARGLRNLDEGDKICFYLKSSKSVVLHGIISSRPKPGAPPEGWDMYNEEGLEYYDTEVELINVDYVKPPVKIAEVREELGLPEKWGNYVIQTHTIDEIEFNILIGAD